MLELDALRLDPELAGEVALEPDRDVAQADRAVAVVDQRLRHQPGGIGEVEEPRPGRAQARGLLGDLEHDRHRPQRLGEPSRTGRLLAEAAEAGWDRLVQEAGGEPAHPKLDEDERRRPPIACFAIGRQRERAGKRELAEDPLGQPADHLEAVGIDVVEDELVDRQALGRSPNPSISSGV